MGARRRAWLRFGRHARMGLELRGRWFGDVLRKLSAGSGSSTGVVLHFLRGQALRVELRYHESAGIIVEKTTIIPRRFSKGGKTRERTIPREGKKGGRNSKKRGK